MGWVSPTSHTPQAEWEDEDKIYDDNEALYGKCSVNNMDWSPYVVVLHAGVYGDKLRFKANKTNGGGGIQQIQIGVFKGGIWVNLGSIPYTHNVWVEKAYALDTVTKVRIRMFNDHVSQWKEARVYELDLWEAGVVHTKTVTEILGLVDGKTTKAAFHKTVSESLGLVDTRDKNKCPKCKPSIIVVF